MPAPAPGREPLPSANFAFSMAQRLPDALPADPMPLARAWLDRAMAGKTQPNPNSMTLATVDADGRPSARIVLCKDMVVDPGYVVFYTNRESRKGRALAGRPHAALVLHWDAMDRQVRLEGPVTPSPDEESDAYFASRPLTSRVAAWASEQSRPLASRGELIRRAAEAMQRLGVKVDQKEAHVARPPHWGGFRVWAQRVELWVGEQSRLHDRAEWTRTLTPAAGGFTCGAWSATRLQP